MLPKLTHRVVTTTLPSTGKQVRFRPWQAREEKILLTSKESGDDETINTAKQVVQNCLLDPIDTDNLPLFDIEWLFIKTRIASVSPIVGVSYIDNSDGKQYDFEVDLEKVELVKSDDVPTHIGLGEGVAVTLRWPRVSDILSPEVMGADDNDTIHVLAKKSIDTVFDGENSTSADEVDPEELEEFVNSFDLESYKTLIGFVAKMPSIKYVIEYQNSKGEERKIVLDSLTDFFIFR